MTPPLWQKVIRSDQISRSVVFDSLRPHRRQPTGLLCPWDSPGKGTGVGRQCLLWTSAYLKFLIFLLAILILVCVTSSLEFRMMYAAYKLNKQGGNIQP